MSELLPWPELETMSKEDLLSIVNKIREGLTYAEDGTDFCLYLCEILKVDVKC